MVMLNNWLRKFLKINIWCLRAGLQHSAGWLSVSKALTFSCFFRESKCYTLVMLGHQRTLSRPNNSFRLNHIRSPFLCYENPLSWEAGTPFHKTS